MARTVFRNAVPPHKIAPKASRVCELRTSNVKHKSYSMESASWYQKALELTMKKNRLGYAQAQRSDEAELLGYGRG